MKKLKIKLEHTFNVPDDTQIIRDEDHGLFIVNEKHGINSMPFIKGFKLDYVNFYENGEFDESVMSDDENSLGDFLFQHAVSEKTTINLGEETHQFKTSS